MTDAAAELSLSKSEVDHLSMTHVRFQQVTHGVPVVGAELAAHYDAQGRLTSIDANYISGIQDVDVEPKISAKLAHDVALGGRRRHDEERRREQARRRAKASSSSSRMASGPRRSRTSTRSARSSATSPRSGSLTVDAKTGEILHRYNNLQTIEATGAGVLGDMKTFQVAQSGSTYAMTRLVARRVDQHVQRERPAGRPAIRAPPRSRRRRSRAGTAACGPGAAVDAHVYAGVVFDYYKKVHARNAIDGAGGAMLSTVHFGQAYDNAFWDGTGMSYGDGGQLFKPLSAGLDVVAHEFTHGVTGATSNLDYQGQSGALNEAVSDIFGVFIEHSLLPDPVKNWIMGERIALGSTGIRDFKTPANGDQPGNMSVFVNTQQDNGGVHINSGIVNNAAFLMTMGGTNPVSKTNVAFGIGWEKSEQLWYRANTKYFMTTTNFAQAAQGVMQAAKDIALTENEQNIVDCAWKATGVVQGTCATITDPNPTTPSSRTPGTGTDPGTGTGTDPGTGATGAADDTSGADTDHHDAEEEDLPSRPDRGGLVRLQRRRARHDGLRPAGRAARRGARSRRGEPSSQALASHADGASPASHFAAPVVQSARGG